ncbi:carbohydrate porin [Novosphingobium sp. 1949]|uniref:Carbohydrate porin n=1 Tax=Novosphingobium organovorum TaxID=2930092 RepID=A0ABT0BBU1_9SPHN|nr:carbohydrate porin [Novosphingobium organovorum]MCJ2182530.1 carbohydrate porin [Novosphingobium organovorum]
MPIDTARPDAHGRAFAASPTPLRILPRIGPGRARRANLVLRAGLSLAAVASGLGGQAHAQTSRDAIAIRQPASDQADSPVAQDPQVSTPDFGLTGHWGGLRDDLHAAGIDISGSVWSEIAGNVSGGTRKDVTQVSGWAINLDGDTEKLFGLEGGHFQVSFTKRQGPDINQRAGLEMLLSPQEQYSRGQTYRLSELWYQQQLGPITDIKLGRMGMGDDFGALPCEFQNVNFCANQIGPLVGNYWYNNPLDPLAVRLRVKPGKFTFMAGVFQSNPNDEKEDVALYHKGANGVTVPIEAGWASLVGGLPGSYRVGAWYNTARADDLLDDANGQPFAISGLDPDRKRGRYGAYLLARQQVTGTYKEGPPGPETTRGLTVFFNAMQADRRTSRTDSQIAAWLVYTAPFAGRPHDSIGLAVSRENVNSRAALSETLADPASTAPRAEYASELHYAFEVVPHFVLSPNVQYIVHPGGYPDRHDIVVLGLKTMLAL